MSIGPTGGFLTVALMFFTSVAVAASLPVEDGDKTPAAPSAAALARFYPTPLATSPAGVVEDQAVWLAKVQGLVSNAPLWLQQNVLASRTKAEFSANLALLQQMQKGTLEEAGDAVRGLAASGRMAAKDKDPSLGAHSQADLVYTALAPCRIMDTRSATGGGLTGPLTGNQLYALPGYVTAGSNWGSYGGNASSDCGLTDVVKPYIWALAMVITILNPNFDAYLGVSDNASLATVLQNVALNYTHGQGLSTQYITPQVLGNIIYFAMPAGLSANIIFDVVGYFAVSQATALDCMYPTATGATLSGNNFMFLALPACPTGYTRTGAGCHTGNTVFSNEPLQVLSIGSGFQNTPGCLWYNGSGSIEETAHHSESTCCRLPGR